MQEAIMTAITADDIRVLARSATADAALARVGDDIRVVPDGPGDEVSSAQIVYTKAQLIEDYGAELSDVEAEVLAAGLTAELAGGGSTDRQRPDTDVTDAPGTVEPPD
jgi:hypothetical protein